MFKRTSYLIALIMSLAAVGCAISAEPPASEADAQLIPANHCGTLTASDDGPILIGTDPDELGPAPSPTEYSVSFDFRFYTQNARLVVTEVCP